MKEEPIYETDKFQLFRPGAGRYRPRSQLDWLRPEAGVRPKNTAGAGSDSGNWFAVRSRSCIHWRGLSARSEQSWFPSSRKDYEPLGRYGAVCPCWTAAHDD